MNRLKNLDSCIQILKGMRGAQSNELGSEQHRAIGAPAGRLDQETEEAVKSEST